MILPSIENFLKILRFYQLNDFKTTKKTSKDTYSSKYITTDKFYNSLNYDYEQGSEGLKYPEDEDPIRLAINARIDLSKYFNNAGFPGSYAFNTPDGFRTKSLMLDWSSTIKTFQDSTDRITNAYALSSEECDKAIAGFGIDFINSRTLPSLNRRQTFLLNICELYKIKGSPQSIVKALNIIGIENCYIQEAWVYPTRDGLRNVEFKWIPVENPQQFDPETNEYYDDNDQLETDYWSWGTFNDMLATIKECHWFYTKQEILNLEYDPDTYIHLPSLTPYFNVKIKYTDKSTESVMSNLFDKVGEQFVNYLNGTANPVDCTISGFPYNVSFLELWCAFLYINISYSDYLRYISLKKYLEKFAVIKNLDVNEYDTEYRYFNLIYKLYTYFKSLKTDFQIERFRQSIALYSQTSVPLSDLSYSQVKYWWISHPHQIEDDNNGLTAFRKIIQPSKIDTVYNIDLQYLKIYWNEDQNYGYYDVEFLDDDKTWKKAYENCKVSSESMQKVVFLSINSIRVTPSKLDELYDRIRIVHYRTENNIPPIFFEHPFNINTSDRDTSTDMLYSFNIKTIQDNLFNKELFHALYEEQNSSISKDITSTDLYKNTIEKFKFQKIRSTDVDLVYKTYFNSLFKYPTSILKEDRDTLYRNSFYRYVIEPTHNYINYLEHDGENLNFINYDNRRYPLNKKWNWAISYGKSINETYFYINYESNKWCRFKSFKLIQTDNIPVNVELYGDNDYGIPVYTNKDNSESESESESWSESESESESDSDIFHKPTGIMWFKVCQQNLNKNTGCYFSINKDNCLMEDEWNALQYSIKKIPYSNNMKDFLDECNVKYSIRNNNIEVLVPPSDLYPSTTIQEKTFVLNDNKSTQVKFYFCDTLMKPESKMAKQFVVAKISPIDAANIYDNVIDCYNSKRKDIYLENDIQLSNLIKITINPFYDEREVKDFTYLNLLRYLYQNGYTLDINGYIYKKFNYYLDENNYLYIKCIDLSKKIRYNKDIVNFRWVRVKCSKQWKNKNTKSIYYKLDNNFNYQIDLDGQRIHNLYGIPYNPVMTFKNVYDSRRYLSDPVLDSTILEINDESVSDNIYDILKISEKNNFKCYAKFDNDLNVDQNKFIYLEESKIPKYINKQPVISNKDSPLLNIVNFGLNQNLLDWLNAQISKYINSTNQYEELIVKLCDSLQDYLRVHLGIIQTLDIYNNHIFKSRLVANVINFYKPKRDRMLSITSSITSDDYDRVFCDGTSDYTYNKLFLNDIDSKENLYHNKKNTGLHNRSTIKHEIKEYVPFDDLIYLDPEKVSTDANNEREVYPEDTFIIPYMECYDRVEAFTKYPAQIDSKIIYASFYCSNIEPKYTGYYYKQPDVSDYYCNDYVFKKKEFLFKSLYDVDGKKFTEPNYIRIIVWTLTNKLVDKIKDVYNALDILDCIYISEPYTTSVPWENQTKNPLIYKKINISSSVDKIKYLEENFVYDYFIRKSHNIDIKFQIYDELSNIYTKINLRNIDPVVYFGNFESIEYNGFYYNSTLKYGYPAYVNNRGKMICLFDMSMLPDWYLDTYIKDYRNEYDGIKCNKFWIITDYKEVPDFNDAYYFAFETGYKGKESIFEYNKGILTEKTKTFYKVKDVSKSDYLYLTGFIGWNVNILNEHPEYINRFDKVRYKYELPDNYSKMVGRRISQNILPEKYVPISCINFNFGYSLTDLINNNYYKISLTSNNNVVDLYKNQYTYNEYNSLAALRIYKNQKLQIKDTYNDRFKTIVFKVKNSGEPYKFITENDGKWHTYAIVIQDTIKILYVDGKFKKNAEYDSVIEIVSNDCCISDYAIFKEALPDWYISIISDYGIFRNRKNIAYRNNTSTYYGNWIFGVPPTTVGDRLHSKFVNYIGDEYFKYPDPKNEMFDTYKWNIMCRYYPDDIYELTNLWASKIKNRVYDRELIPQFNKCGEIDRVIVGKRYYYKNKAELNGNENFPRLYDNRMFINGVEYNVSSNYVFEHEIPPWYMKKPATYKTGDIIHNPIHITTLQNIDDPYPIVKHGEKYISYFDYDHLTDGIELDNNAIYQNQQYDDNTKYIQALDEFMSEEEFFFKFNYDVHSYNNVVLENHNNRHACPCEDIDKLPMFFDPSIINLTQEMKDNHIYHNTIRLKKNEIIDDTLCGIYKVEKNSFKEKYDFDYCYTKICKNNTEYDHFNSVVNSKDKKWDSEGIVTPNSINICQRISAVPVYFEMSGYQTWELRKYTIYLYNSNSINIEKLDNLQKLIKNNKIDIIGFDGKKNYNYNMAIFMDKIAFTYIKSNYYIPYQNKDYNFINQFQYDICGQKLCEYNIDIENELKQQYVQNINQKIIHDIGFINYETIEFVKKSEIKEYFSDEFDTKRDYDGGRFYLFNNNLYIKINQYWYGPFYVKTTRDLPYQLNEITCLDTVYTLDNVYIKTQKGWVSIYYHTGSSSNNTINELFVIDYNFYINIIYTDKDLPEWSYYVDKANILQTLRIFKDNNFNIINKNKKEFINGFINKQTVTDYLWMYLFYICKFPLEKICLCKDCHCMEVKNPRCKHKMFNNKTKDV